MRARHRRAMIHPRSSALMCGCDCLGLATATLRRVPDPRRCCRAIPLLSGWLMHTTSLSLLDRLRQAKPDAAEWRRLHDVYLPVIRSWLARVPGLHDEAQDLSQDVLVVLFRELPSFERQRNGSFRAWLRQITVNRIRSFWKRGASSRWAWARKPTTSWRNSRIPIASWPTGGTRSTTATSSRSCWPSFSRTSSPAPGKRSTVSHSTARRRRAWPRNWACPRLRSCKPSSES